MAKHLKINIKNAQIAEAVSLKGIKEKLANKQATETPPPKKQPAAKPSKSKAAKEEAETVTKTAKEEQSPRVRARSKSVFVEPAQKTASPAAEEPIEEALPAEPVVAEEVPPPTSNVAKANEELRKKVFGGETVPPEPVAPSKLRSMLAADVEKIPEEVAPSPKPEIKKETPPPAPVVEPKRAVAPHETLGPTGRHVRDLLPPKQAPAPQAASAVESEAEKSSKPKSKGKVIETSDVEGAETRRGSSKAPVKEFRDVKPARRQQEGMRTFDARDRQGLRDTEEDQRWRKKRLSKAGRPKQEEIPVVRPTALKVRVPISIKDLAVEMKLKASQLISKLFMQGVIVTLNDLLDDETTIQLLGQEFGCELSIDTSEEQRIRITDKSVKEEIKASTSEDLIIRPPVVAFMGHVDHGKTSLIDAIRKSNRAAGEAGAITQHIGAFRCHTSVGDITILDTPGHEAFSEMRARGADVTDIVVLVVAGDEGVRQQTIEAMQHAKSANVTIVVALNKSDKPGFNPDQVYRQLADNELLPEVWGGQTLTVNCSATTGAGIKELLEMLALQAEVLELKANPHMRARGAVLESEMHKGMGAVATVLVQNGTLKIGDALVFEQHWGHVKTMRDEFDNQLQEAPPSTPVEITGLSGLPAAGQEFIVVKSEREAREIAEVRMQGMRQLLMQQPKKFTAESLLQQATPTNKKTLNLILRADVQGSLEALKTALGKINSTKAEVNILFTGVGEVTESDIQLAATSKAAVIGFHTKVESHAEALSKQLNVKIRLHNIIYHAIDDVKELMRGLLDKIAQENDRGKLEVKALFKSSHAGMIAGCIVTEGTVQRNHMVRVVRAGTIIGRASINSLRRVKEDVREVSKGVECGIILNKFTDVQEGDILEAYETTYIEQDL